MTDIRQELLEVQKKLKAPKDQNNSFGKYKYRKAEDILEAVKQVTTQPVTIDQEVVLIGDRYYVKSTATFGVFTMDSISVTAFARESETKKGMDESQITGAASTYSKKYALQNLFAVDDSEDDPDSKDNSMVEKKAPSGDKMTPVEKKAPEKPKLQEMTDELLCSKIRAMEQQKTFGGLEKIRLEIKDEYELNAEQRKTLGVCYEAVTKKIKENK